MDEEDEEGWSVLCVWSGLAGDLPVKSGETESFRLPHTGVQILSLSSVS